MKREGVLPVATLGTEDFNVFQINATVGLLESLRRIPCSIYYQGVSAPEEDGAACECAETGPDGYVDPVFHFDTQVIVARFLYIDELQYIVDYWWVDYNQYGLQNALGQMCRVVFVARCLGAGSAAFHRT